MFLFFLIFSARFSPLIKTSFVLWLFINHTGMQYSVHKLTFCTAWEKTQIRGDFKSVDPKPTAGCADLDLTVSQSVQNSF